MGSPKLPDKIRKAFPAEQAHTINQAVSSISVQVQRYIWAKTFTSIITGASMLLLCLIFSIDFAVTWGFFMFLLNYIPTIGPLIGAIPPLLVLLIKTGSWVHVVWAAVIMLAVFLTLGNYIEPVILGESVNLSPLVALCAIIFWGWLWGPAGMLVAVPITAVFKFTCDNVSILKPLGVLMSGKA
jgi:predicted PurR-regulated permease PerM